MDGKKPGDDQEDDRADPSKGFPSVLAREARAGSVCRPGDSDGNSSCESKTNKVPVCGYSGNWVV